MKKIINIMLALAVLGIAACQSGPKGGVCHIVGTMESDQWDGKYMFLVPMKNADSIGVDSVKVKGRTFELTTDKQLMAVLRMDYHFRYGLQDLLVVLEPGEVQVTIGAESSALGTPQNNVLQTWKQRTQVHNSQLGAFRKAASQQKADSVVYKRLTAKADSVHKEYRDFTRQLAKELGEGTLHDFFDGLYPTSYQKKMPDGSIQTLPLD